MLCLLQGTSRAISDSRGTERAVSDSILFFIVPDLKKYLAELSMEEKNALSHRGKALLALKSFLNMDFFRRPRGLNL